MKTRRTGFSVIVICLLLWQLLPASSTAGILQALDLFPEAFTHTEKAFFTDLSDGRLDEHDDFDTFLIASDIVQSDSFKRYQKKLTAIRNMMPETVKDAVDPYDRGNALLFWMHDTIFTTYVLSAGRAGKLLDNGAYNCLSASILYMLLAGELDLPVRGVLVPEHAFCVLLDPRGDKYIETTVRYGFDPGTVAVEKLENLTRYVYLPEKTYPDRKIVPLRGMLALLYTNHLSFDSYSVDGAETAYLPKLLKAHLLDPTNTLFTENLVVCLHNLALSSLNSKNFDAARDYIQKGLILAPESNNFAGLEVQLFNQEAGSLFDRRDHRGAIALMRQAFNSYPDNLTVANNLRYFYEQWALSFMAQNDFAAAQKLFEEALKAFPEEEDLRANLRIVFFNQAVMAYNNNDYRGAVDVSRKALDYFPGDALFLDVIEKAVSSDLR